MGPDSSEEQAQEVTIVAHDIGPVGGMERQLVQLIKGLQGLGHEITVIGRVCELPPGCEVTFRRVSGPGRPFLLAYPWFLLAGSVAVRRWRRGVVQATGAIVLNPVDAIAVHYCQQAGIATATRATAFARAYAAVVERLNKVGERLCFSLNPAALFLCVSEGVSDELRHYYPRAAERVLTVHNGVDASAFAPGARDAEIASFRAQLGVAPERKLAAFVGGEWERKGLEEAIQALAEAREWDLVVAGAGDRDRYSRLAASLGVASAVHWLGVTRDVPLVFAVADALVFPSTYEAFPLVVLEAAAAGLPILATPVNGVRELLADGVSGLVIERDPGSIAAGLRTLAADPALAARMGAAAREAALGYSWERMVSAHHDLYQRIGAARRTVSSAPGGLVDRVE
jgi:UDP-glucose:(heptosyl)LPS alpha-1,3-glucosyltransferase